jgi:hypothetical protein
MPCLNLPDSAGLLGYKTGSISYTWRKYAFTMCGACHPRRQTAYMELPLSLRCTATCKARQCNPTCTGLMSYLVNPACSSLPSQASCCCRSNGCTQPSLSIQSQLTAAPAAAAAAVACRLRHSLLWLRQCCSWQALLQYLQKHSTPCSSSSGACNHQQHVFRYYIAAPRL